MPSSVNESAAPTDPTAQVRRAWLSLQYLPFSIRAAHEGVSAQSLLVRETGLSQAHISTHGLSVANPQRAEKVAEHMAKLKSQRLMEAGLTGDELEGVLAQPPRGSLEAFARNLELATGQSFAYSADVGHTLDKVVNGGAIAGAAAEHDLDAYKGWLARLLDEDAPDLPLACADFGAPALKAAVDAATSWEDVVSPSERLVDVMLFSYLAALDLDWSTGYFTTVAPAPTLVWLWPRLREGFNPSTAATKRGAVVRPAQNLLQLMWLIVQRRFTGRWPSAWPGPHRVEQDTGLDELEAVRMRQLFSGHARLRSNACLQVWRGLCKAASGEPPENPPALWIILGVWMQKHLVASRQKGDPVEHWVLSAPVYRELWEGHRKRKQLRDATARTVEWPSWLLNQASSWELLDRSSQLSGRSSWPRDCQ